MPMMTFRLLLATLMLLTACATNSARYDSLENCLTAESKSEDEIVAIARICTLETTRNTDDCGICYAGIPASNLNFYPLFDPFNDDAFWNS